MSAPCSASSVSSSSDARRGFPLGLYGGGASGVPYHQGVRGSAQVATVGEISCGTKIFFAAFAAARRFSPPESPLIAGDLPEILAETVVFCHLSADWGFAMKVVGLLDVGVLPPRSYLIFRLQKPGFTFSY